MNANADPDERPTLSDSSSGPADSEHSFEAWHANLSAAAPSEGQSEESDSPHGSLSLEAGSAGGSLAHARCGPQLRELELLAELAQLSAERAQGEREIEERFAADRAATEQGLQQEQQEFAEWLETEARQTVEAHAELERKAEARYDRDTAATENGWTELQARVAVEFDKAREAVNKSQTDARFEADTQFDAQKAVAPRKLAEFTAQLDAWRVRIGTDRETAFKLLKRWKQPAPQTSSDTPSPCATSGDLATRMQGRVDFVALQLAALSRLSSPKMLRSIALPIVYLLVVLGAAGAVTFLGPGPVFGVAALVAGLVLGVLCRLLIKSSARSAIKELYPPLVAAAREVEEMVQRALDKAREQTAAAQSKLDERREAAQAKADKAHAARMAQIDAQRDQRLKAPGEAYRRRLEQIDQRRDRDMAQARQTRAEREAERLRRQKTEPAEIQRRYAERVAEIDKLHDIQWSELAERWRSGLARLQALAELIVSHGGEPAGDDALNPFSHWAGNSWSPSTVTPPAVRFGEFLVRMDQIPGGVPTDSRLAAMTPAGFSLPAVMPFPQRPSLMLRARGNGRQVAVDAIQALMLRLLVTLPPSKVRFTIVDPVGLGENFAAFMHLADFNEALVTSRIWTEPKHIEERLADLSEHMENVIQRYLRNEFQSIEEYNQDAGEIAEPFRFLVIANYPAGFSEAAQRRLLSIIASGARCGVYTLLMADTQVPMSAGFSLRDFEPHSTTLQWNSGRFMWKDDKFGQYDLTLDSPPPPAQVTEMLHAAGRYANEAGKVEVPFEVIAPPADKQWTSSSAKGFDVALGRAGATRLQHIKLGKGTSQHVIIGGKTGSGKSTLLHALITNAALHYSPDEVELYLIDFKQGVEFKTYVTHNLPHARIVAIESDREFGVSVLGRLDTEIRTRADRFRDLGVQDLNGYRKADPVHPLPRILMIVDEFQEFFTEDDKVAQDASLLLDRLVRQGRAFGIHVLLGSQTLAGTYTLARSTLGQMAVRIALQCSEADAHLILSEENGAARLLTRAGEAIYNDSNGMVAGNHFFQVVWLPDERRELFLDQVEALVERHKYPRKEQIVFEGNVPADPATNKALIALLGRGRPARPPEAAHVWLGDAVAIKDPTAITFRAQSGSNLLIVGQNEDAALGIMTTALIGLAAQHPASHQNGARFYFLDGSSPGSPQAAALARLPSLTSDMVKIVSAREMPAAVNEVTLEVERRQKAAQAELPPIFIFIFGLQKLRDLRKPEDDFSFARPGENQPPNPGKQFGAILRDGPVWGVHTIVWCDGVNNLNRTWDRQTLRELEMRVVFQMSANDSSTLIDSPTAGKLGKNRGLFHSEEQGILEKFRPYRWPGEEWLAMVREQLGGGQVQNGAAAVEPPASAAPAAPAISSPQISSPASAGPNDVQPPSVAPAAARPAEIPPAESQPTGTQQPDAASPNRAPADAGWPSWGASAEPMSAGSTSAPLAGAAPADSRWPSWGSSAPLPAADSPTAGFPAAAPTDPANSGMPAPGAQPRGNGAIDKFMAEFEAYLASRPSEGTPPPKVAPEAAPSAPADPPNDEKADGT
jgi:DNA segregation ATPase FtsK/SpoIIIE, S-DNA-T family